MLHASCVVHPKVLGCHQKAVLRWFELGAPKGCGYGVCQGLQSLTLVAGVNIPALRYQWLWQGACLRGVPRCEPSTIEGA